MAREKEGYRDMIEQLNHFYPGKEFLTAEEVATFINKSKRTVERHFKDCQVKPCGYSKIKLAKALV